MSFRHGFDSASRLEAPVNREPGTRPVSAPSLIPPTPRARGLALAASALILLTMFSLQLGAIIRSAWLSVLQAGPASPDQLVAAVAGSCALALVVWLLGAILLSVLAALGSRRSALSRATANGARMVAPLVLRNAIAALLGMAIAAAPAAANATSGRAIGARSPTVTQSAQSLRSLQPDPAAAIAQTPKRQPLSPAWVPLPDGPATAGNATTAGTSATAGPYAPAITTPAETANAVTPPAIIDRALRETDLLPGWLPSRPPSASQPTGTDQPTRTSQPTRVGRPTGSQPGRASETSGTNQPTDTNQPGDTDRPPGAVRFPAAGRPSGTAGHLAPPASGSQTRAKTPDEVVVRRGDTLWDIAARYLGPAATTGEIAREWPHWFAVNRSVIGNDPDHLVPGERLRIPATQGESR